MRRHWNERQIKRRKTKNFDTRGTQFIPAQSYIFDSAGWCGFMTRTLASVLLKSVELNSVKRQAGWLRARIITIRKKSFIPRLAHRDDSVLHDSQRELTRTHADAWNEDLALRGGRRGMGESRRISSGAWGKNRSGRHLIYSRIG